MDIVSASDVNTQSIEPTRHAPDRSPFALTSSTHRALTLRSSALTLLLAFTTSATALSLGKPGLDQKSCIDSSLLKYLRQRLADPAEGPDLSTSMLVRCAPVSPGRTEVFVYLRAHSWCGTGGCTFLILEQSGASYRTLGELAVAQLPIRMLPTSSNGHPDIGVQVRGGGIVPGYEAVLSFNGKHYPSNPTVRPAHRARNPGSGTIIMSPEDRGASLY